MGLNVTTNADQVRRLQPRDDLQDLTYRWRRMAYSLECSAGPDNPWPARLAHQTVRLGLDLNTAFEAIRISSGTSFVHKIESQVILNGSCDIDFSMGLAAKDIGLLRAIADRAQVPLEISPRLIEIFDDGIARLSAWAFSPTSSNAWK